jgi:endoglucanase
MAAHCRYSQLVRVTPCLSQFARSSDPAVAAACKTFDVQTKGSAIPLYNSTTYYDDLLWAAAWMYKATGDQTYLKDAEDFYVRYLYNEQGSERLLYNWNDYFWAANVFLVNVRHAQLSDA